MQQSVLPPEGAKADSLLDADFVLRFLIRNLWRCKVGEEVR